MGMGVGVSFVEARAGIDGVELEMETEAAGTGTGAEGMGEEIRGVRVSISVGGGMGGVETSDLLRRGLRGLMRYSGMV